MSKRWFILQDGKQVGPFNREELTELGFEGKIEPEVMVYREGMVPAISMQQEFLSATSGT